MTTTGRVVAVSTLAALVVLAPIVPAGVRIAVAAWFLVAVPGLAWTFALPTDGPIERGATAVALSLTFDVLVAEALLFVGRAGIIPAAAVLAAIAGAGILVDARHPPVKELSEQVVRT